MKDKSKTQEQLIKETAEMRQRVTELEESEAKLKGIITEIQKPEHRYRVIFDSMGDAIHIIDRELRIVLANRAFAEWVRLMPIRADIVGLTVFEAFPFLKETVRDEYEQVFRTGRPLVTEECSILDDRKIYTETRKIPIMEEDRVVQIITVIRDISARKQAEEVMEKRLVALTQPLEDAVGIAFEDLFDMDEIQRIQDEFANATGVASIITHVDGTPITKPSNFCRLCNDIIRKTARGRKNCYQSDAIIGQRHPSGPIVQPCLSGGLWDAGASISVGGRHIANWLIGQVLNEAQTEEQMLAYAREIGADEQTFMEAFRDVTTMSRQRFEQIAQALFTLANQLSNSAYQTIQQARFISERKKAEEVLRETKRRLTDIIEFLPDATLVIDKDGTVVAWNRALEAMTGVRAEEMLGKGNYEYALPFYGDRRPILIDLALHPNPEMEQEYTAIYRSGDIIFGEAYTPNLSPGNIHLSATASVLRDSGGEIIAAIECIRNNTERKRLESQLQQAQKMEAIGTLAGGIAHDFNNILAAILGYTQLGLDEPDEERRQRYLNQVLKSGERAKNLTGQILAFSRQDKQERSPIEVGGIVKEAMKLLRSVLPTTVEIRQEIESEPSIVLSNSIQIHQVLMNLCTNAAHAMRDKGGMLQVCLDHIQFSAKDDSMTVELQPGSYVRLIVKDTGHGIDPGIIDRIFDPFFTTKKIDEGTGLGLSVVYGIVKSHGGTITVQSEPRKGSIFSVYFPRIEVQIEQKSERPQPIQKGSERVLFVDDEPILAEIGKEALSALGYEVTVRTSSIEAIDVFRTQPRKFDLVITDMTMPNMTGVQLADEILKARPDIPIILCTGYSEMIDEEKSKKFGIRAFLMKPVMLEEMARTIRKVLDK